MPFSVTPSYIILARRCVMTTIETVKTDEFTMDYLKFGHGLGTYVIIPGLSIQSVMGSADAVVDGFSLAHDDFTIYLFDRRNELPPTYTIYDMAKDTAAAIKALGLTDICLFGASQGGMIAMTIAIEHPELVKKLALGSTSSHVTKEQADGIDEWIEQAKKGDREGLYLSFGQKVYPPAVFEQFRDYFIETAKTVTDEELQRFVILASGMHGFNVTDRLKDIQCPVYTTGTFEDEVLDSDSTMEIAQELDEKEGFRLYMYIGYGHASFDTAPDYRKRVMDFFLK
ncbi:MAG: alpha/beta hydrolase [Butyrivibrio sp.]|nr:alpha/beta hydrolase [Butyrivibrio sp.]